MPGSFPFEFASPWYLALLAAVPLVYWAGRRSLAGLEGPRRFVCLALRYTVVTLLVLALAELRILQRNDRLAVIFLVDRSESIPAEKREAARQYVVEFSKLRDPVREDLVGVVAFGRAAGLEAMPRSDPLELESFVTLIEPDSTDISAAVRLAVAAFPEGYGKRIVILSDGNENRGSLLDEVRSARARGITVDVVPIVYSYPAEISVEKLLLDPEVHVGQPFNVRAVVTATVETEAVLRLFENNALVPTGDPKVKLRPGKNVFDFPRRFEVSGKHDYEVRVEPVDPRGDSVLQNNAASGFTYIQGEPTVLLCSAEPDLEGALIQALREEKIAVKSIRPEDLPRTMEEYFDYQAIILSNVAAHDLSEEKMKLFEALVKAVGIGFVMLGGENSFGAGGYQGTPVERLLPVDMEIKQRKVLPNGALAMVVHSCELGNGNWWAAQVIQQSLRILSPRDYAGVLYYGMGDQWLFPMTRISERQMMLSRLRGFNPGDMMSFEGIMLMALAGLTTTEASIKHIIVLSDGDPVMPSAATIQKINAAGITISTICYGAHGGIPPGMKVLAQQGGGKFYYLQNPSNLPEIFIREATTVQKSLISEERFTPGLHVRGAMMQGIEETGIPPLDGYVITSPKELATLHMLHPPSAEDPTQDPVLASWTYGLGRTVAFTSDAGRRWGRAWAAWSGYQQFWSQLVRWVSRPKNDDRFRLTRSIEGENALVSIDAITPDGRFLNGIGFAGTVTGPDLEPQPLPVRQVGPGLYRAEFPARKRGTYTVTLSHERDGRPASHVTGLTVPYSPEYRPLETNRDLLRQAEAAGAGKYHEDAGQADFFARDFPVTREVTDIWHTLLLTAIVLFFADVFARRVAVDFRKLAVSALARVTALIRRRRVEALPADARLRTLLERKAKLREVTSARYQPSGGTFAPPRGRPDSTDASASLAGSSAGAAADSSPAPPAPQPAAASPAQKGEAAQSYTARLLEAKKRALNKDGKGTKGP